MATSTGQRDRGKAGLCFTNRVSEIDAFKEAAREHFRRVDHGVTNVDGPYQHVVSFWGMSGIGKSELSSRVQRWLEGGQDEIRLWGPVPAFLRNARCTRFDLRLKNRLDIEQAMIKLRSDATPLGELLEPLDVALRAYWERARPADPLPTLPKLPSMRDTARAVDADGQVVDSVSKELKSAGLRWADQRLAIGAFKAVAKAVSGRNKIRGAHELAADLEWLLDEIRARPDEQTLAECGRLLTIALRNATPGHPQPRWLVFIDQAEVLTAGHDRINEDLVHRMVCTTPDLLWVFTGQDPLRWHEPSMKGVLAAGGPERWPTLDTAARPSAQIRVGELADEDADRLLQQALTDAHGAPLLPASIRASYVSAARGWPLYLSTVVQELRAHLRNGALDERFKHDFSWHGVLATILRGLSEDQRTCLRAASLFEGFNRDLLIATAATPTHSAVREFLRHSLAIPSAAEPGFYYLHGAVRAVVCEAGSHLADAWEPEDRQRAVERAAAYLETAVSTAGDLIVGSTIYAIAQRFCVENNLEAPWLRKAAFKGKIAAASEIPGDLEPTAGSYMDQLFALLRCWRASSDSGASPKRSTHERLGDLLEARDDLCDDIRVAARRFRAYGLRDAGETDEALVLFEELLNEASGDSERRLIQYHMGLTFAQKGDFPEVEKRLEALGAGASTDGADTKALRLRSVIAQWHGDVAAAADMAEERAQALFRAGDARVGVDNRSIALRLLGLTRTDTYQLAHQNIEQHPQYTRFQVSCHSAAATSHAGFDCFAEHFSTLRDSAAEAGVSENNYRLLLPLVFDGVVRQDNFDGPLPDLMRPHDGDGLGLMWRCVMQFWADDPGPSPVPLPVPNWRGLEGSVRRRWRSLVTERRLEVARVGGGALTHR